MKKCTCEIFQQIEGCEHIGQEILNEVGFGEWEKEFDETWTAIKGTKMAEDIKSFISQQIKIARQEVRDEYLD